MSRFKIGEVVGYPTYKIPFPGDKISGHRLGTVEDINCVITPQNIDLNGFSVSVANEIRIEYKIHPMGINGDIHEWIDENELCKLNVTIEEENKMEKFDYDDLKAGMRVEWRDGTIAVLMPTQDGFVMLRGNDTDFDILDKAEYRMDLLHTPGLFFDMKNMDIMKVYGLSHLRGTISSLTSKSSLGDPIWTREENVKEMTVEEISKALGYEVKIVK